MFSTFCDVILIIKMTNLQTEEKKQAAAAVMFQYSKFVMACIGNQVRPCDLRFHLMKVNSLSLDFSSIIVEIIFFWLSLTNRIMME